MSCDKKPDRTYTYFSTRNNRTFQAAECLHKSGLATLFCEGEVVEKFSCSGSIWKSGIAKRKSIHHQVSSHESFQYYLVKILASTILLH
jgi:hypothetical protein